MSGALFGILAAVALGINQILMTYAARRWGTVKATFFSLLIAFVGFIGFTIITDADIPFRGNDLVPLLAGLGVAAGIAYLAQFTSLREGPLSVVAPVGATSGAMTVLFAFILLGERPNFIQWVGIPIATIGAIAVSIELRSDRKIQLISKGPIYAGLAVVSGAISNAVLRIPVRELGPMAAIIFQRAFTVALIAMVFASMARGGRLPVTIAAATGTSKASPTSFLDESNPQSRRLWAGLLLVIGILDAAAFIFFAEGLQRADAWLIGILSQSGRVIAVIGGFTLFHERLRKHQWTGVALVLLGLTLAVSG